MDTIKDTINNLLSGNNYIWAIVALVVIIIAFIGFIADRANKRRKASNLKENNEVKNNPIVEETNNSLASTAPMATTIGEPETIGTPVVKEEPVLNQMPQEEPKIVVEEPINNVVNNQPFGLNNEPYSSRSNTMVNPEPISPINVSPLPNLGNETIPEPMVGLGEAQANIKKEEPTPIPTIEPSIPNMNMDEPINMSMGEPKLEEKKDDIELLS